MESLSEFQVWTRLLIVGVLVALLGLSALPHRIEREYGAVQQASQTNNPLEASKSLSAILAYEPWRTDLPVLIGRYAAQGGDVQAALVYLNRAASSGLLNAQDFITLGDLYASQGNTSLAVQSWSKALPVEDQPAEVYERLLKVHLAGKNYDSIIADLKNLARLRPDLSEYDYQLGLYLAVFEPENALVYLEQAANSDPQVAAKANKLRLSIRTALLADEPAYTFLESGRALASLGEWELAVEAFKQAVQSRSDYAEAWAFLGEAYQHLADEKTTVALGALQQALGLDPTSVDTNSLMALYWQRQGDYDQALIFLKSAARSEPQNPYLQAEIGLIYSQMGELPEAQTCYQHAVDLAPKEMTFWDLLAQFSLSNQIQVREIALPAAREAVLLAPTSPAATDLMGQALFMLGDLYSARRFLDRSLGQDPSYAPAYLHLGLVELYLGDTAQSRQDILHGMEIAPDSAMNDYAQRLLQYYFP